MVGTPRRSGLQAQVLMLYRRCLRMVSTKPPQSRDRFKLFVDYHFRHKYGRDRVSPRDFGTIEYALRSGVKQLEMFEGKGVKDCWISDEMRTWGEQQESARRAAFQRQNTP